MHLAHQSRMDGHNWKYTWEFLWQLFFYIQSFFWLPFKIPITTERIMYYIFEKLHKAFGIISGYLFSKLKNWMVSRKHLRVPNKKWRHKIQMTNDRPVYILPSVNYMLSLLFMNYFRAWKLSMEYPDYLEDDQVYTQIDR